MADENNATSNTDANVPAAQPEPKKQRVGRPPKVAAEMMGGMSPVAKAPRGRRKRSEAPVAAEVPVAVKRAARTVVKDGVKRKPSKQADKPAAAPTSAIDEMADLIQLEEENKKLRKALSDKLRSENADLRKRLGLV